MLSRHCSRWLFQLTKRNSNRNFSTYYWFWKEEKKTLNSRDKNSINFLIFQFQYSSFVSRCWLLLNILFCFGCIAWFLNIQQANKDATCTRERILSTIILLGNASKDPNSMIQIAHYLFISKYQVWSQNETKATAFYCEDSGKTSLLSCLRAWKTWELLSNIWALRL